MPSRSSGAIVATVAVAAALLSARAALAAEAMRATVQRVDGTMVELDVGRRDGVARGARFTIFTLGKVVRIPLTNTVTYKEGQPVAVVRVVEIAEMSSTCAIEKRETGATISVGLDAVWNSGLVSGGGRPAGGTTSGSTPLTVPSGTSAPFSITLSAPSDRNITVFAIADANGKMYRVNPDISGVDYTNMPETTHTIDEGPMSDAVAIFTNGVLKFTGNPMYMVGFGIL